MSDKDKLVRRIDLAIAVVLDAQEIEHRNGLTTRRTRQLPRSVLRQLRHWRRQVLAADGGTLCGVVADSHRGNGQREADKRSRRLSERSPVPVLPASPDQSDRQAVS
jgi:hypothetical protein